MSSQLDLDSILKFTIDLALEAGQMMRDGQEKRFASESASENQKLNSVDLVTEVDKAVEEFITKKISETYPDHEFIGEETYAGQSVTNKPTWIGNPIDGTTNFIHGFPMSCTSIGLAVGGVPVVGVVYNPFLDQLYSAAQGRGAYLNRKTKLPLTGKPKPLPSLGQALCAVEMGSSRSPPALPSKIGTFQKLAAHTDQAGKMVHSLRSVGSAALNICLVASGGIDIYWEIGVWPWDVCAGICILSEAGGASFGSKANPLTGNIDAALLAGRKYLFIRDIAPLSSSETKFDVQKRFAEEFYTTVEEWDP